MDKIEISNRIKNIRNSLGLSMEAFGEKIDKEKPVKSGVVSNWENGKQLPNKKRLKRIAELGNMSIDNLLYGDPVTFLYDNLELEDEYEFGSIEDLTSKGRLKIAEMCIREYQEYKSIEINNLFNPIERHKIKDYNDLLNFANKNVSSIMKNMIELSDMAFSHFKNYSIEDIKKLSDTNIIYKKYCNGETITPIDKINNFLTANNLDLENKLYRYQSKNYFVADVINDLIKYGIKLSKINKIDEMDKITEENLTKFLTACLRVDEESEILNNTILENSNLKEYIKNGLVDDLDILSQVLNEKYKNQ